MAENNTSSTKQQADALTDVVDYILLCDIKSYAESATAATNSDPVW